MSLVQFDPFSTDIDRAFDQWGRRMERMLRGFETPSLLAATSPMNPMLTTGTTHVIPAIDVIDNEKELTVVTELPGVKKEDIKVEVQDNQLVVTGEQKTERKYERENYVRRERSSGSFRRSVTLPRNVDAQNVKASFDNGLLEVRVPKKQLESSQRKTITVA